tara:strand:+ start:554 stop:820 length:267 start_codon:yes stop_codon:yes gene_type:complete
MEHGPLKDPTFTNAMEVFIRNNTYASLANKLGELDKESQFIEYYTYDCALCYLTWKAIKDDPDMSDPKNKLRKRIIENLHKLKKRGSS